MTYYSFRAILCVRGEQDMKRNDSRLNEILNIMNAMSDNEYESIINILYSKLSENKAADNSVYAFVSHGNEGVVCKHCGSFHVVKNGRDRYGHQRYQCKHCDKWFSDTSLSTISGTHKNSFVWKKYIRLLFEGKTIATCAHECGLCIQTSFVWRHKILNTLSKNAFASDFNGMIEMDEMFFRISYKGNHKKSKNFVMPRKACKRGSDNVNAHGYSKACVLCVVNRNNSFSGIVPCKGMINLPMLRNVFENNQINSESIVMTDGFRAYNQYFTETNIEHIILPATRDKKPAVKGAYHINNVNALHSRFRRFLEKYNGVATKYLGHYLGMFLWIENHRKENIADITCNEIIACGTQLRTKDFVNFAPEPDFAPAA